MHYLYDVLRPHLPPVAEYSGHSAASFYIRAAFSPDGSHFISGSSENKAYIWQVAAVDTALDIQVLGGLLMNSSMSPSLCSTPTPRGRWRISCRLVVSHMTYKRRAHIATWQYVIPSIPATWLSSLLAPLLIQSRDGSLQEAFPGKNLTTY